MTGSEKVSAKTSCKYLKYFVYPVGRCKKSAFMSRLTLCCLLKECANDLILLIDRISFKKTIMNFNMANAKCSLWEGRALCNRIGWELNGCGAALLERTLAPWETQAEHEPAYVLWQQRWSKVCWAVLKIVQLIGGRSDYSLYSTLSKPFPGHSV